MRSGCVCFSWARVMSFARMVGDSSNRKRYQSGISERKSVVTLLPRPVRACCIARTEAQASPSGRVCVVIKMLLEFLIKSSAFLKSSGVVMFILFAAF